MPDYKVWYDVYSENFGAYNSVEYVFTQRFVGCERNCVDWIVEDFEIDISELNGATILFARYWGCSWDGTAFVLFLRDGKLYEVNANHCSCFGLEGQWEPEEAYIAELRHRMDEGEFGIDRFDGDGNFADKLKIVLDLFEAGKLDGKIHKRVYKNPESN